MQDAIDKGAKALPSAYASNVSIDLAFKQHSGYQDSAIDLTSSKLAFDVDVSGLKAGNKVHIADISLTSDDAPEWAGNNDLMYLVLGNSPHVYINGVDYGYLTISNGGNGQNGGDQGTKDGKRETADRSVHELFFVLQKDYQGIGKQHVEVKLRNGSVNYEVGPLNFNNKSSINITMKVTDHSGKTIVQDNLILNKPVGQGNVAGRQNDIDQYTGNGTNGFTPALYWNQALSGNQVLTVNDKLNDQDSYIMASRISSTAKLLGFEKEPSERIDLSWVVFNSNGQSLPMNRAVETSNLGKNKIPLQVMQKGLTEQQLLSQLNRSKTYALASEQSDGSYVVITNIAKAWMQERVKSALGSAESIMTKYGAWEIEKDNNPQKALQNTLDFYKSNDYLPTGISIWHSPLFYTDPNSQGTSTIQAHSIGSTGQYSYNMTRSIAKPVPSALISGQSGIKVHYIDGSTGKDLRQISNSIGDPNKTTSVTPELIPGYNLTTEGAKGIPSGAQTIESNTQVAYPRDGTWKDVYIVYMPYLPSGTTKARFHYDTKSVKILMPEVLIYGHFRHYLHVL